jgi:uncharacterized protein (TIGR03663 family)
VRHAAWFAGVLVAIAVGALAIRLPVLGNRPMHADEAVQAARFRDLWQDGQYVYDPNEFHGPTLAYATLATVRLSRCETFAQSVESTYRIVPVVFGGALIAVLWLLRDAVGRWGVVGGAVLAAVSPALVFYSRYYIHETLLVFFTAGALGCGWRYLRGGKISWCLLAGACVGLMQATKETAAITYLAALVAAACMFGAAWRQKGDRQREWPASRWAWHGLLGAAAAVLVWAAFLSSFGANGRGPLDGILTYVPWLTRAGGDSPHVYPWTFYLHRLIAWRVDSGPWCSEGLIVGLACVGLLIGWCSPQRLPADAHVGFVRWLGCYTVTITAIYSLIPYKTPWCLLQFLLPMILLAGVGGAALVRLVPIGLARWAVVAGLVLALTHLTWQAYRAAYQFPASPANPYVFAQTSPDALRLAERLDQLAAATEDSSPTSAQVVWSDLYYWPLPWYLRRFERAEYWTQVPSSEGAGVVIASPMYDRVLTALLNDTHLMTGYYELRPQVLAQMWVRLDLWERHLRRIGALDE